MRRRAETVTVGRQSQALGQVAPSATTATTLYTCPKKVRATGVVTICSLDAGTQSFRVALRPNGDALDPKHYLVYDYSIEAGDALYTIPLELEPDDVLTVYGSSATLTFAFVGTTTPMDTT